MASHKRLNGLTHDIMDHAVSGLSYLHPHLAQVSAMSGSHTITLDLLADSPLADDLRSVEPAVSACRTLHRTFLTLLAKFGYAAQDIASAALVFEFPDAPLDIPYRFTCTAEVVSSRGSRFQHRMHTDTRYRKGKAGRRQ